MHVEEMTVCRAEEMRSIKNLEMKNHNEHCLHWADFVCYRNVNLKLNYQLKSLERITDTVIKVLVFPASYGGQNQSVNQKMNTSLIENVV